jgi:hypothetical protein
MCEIPIDAGMAGAFKGGLEQYRPLCDGIKLEPECGDPATTTRNLHSVVSSRPERAIQGVIASGVSDRGILILLKTGESYLATGYSIGTDGPKTAELARFLVDHNDGDLLEEYDEMFELLATWPSDLAGPVPILNR